MADLTPLQIHLIREIQNTVRFPIRRPYLITHKPNNPIRLIDQIFNGNADFSDRFVSKIEPFMAQIEKKKQMIAIPNPRLVQIESHLVIPFRILIFFFIGRRSLLLVSLQFFVRIVTDNGDLSIYQEFLKVIEGPQIFGV